MIPEPDQLAADIRALLREQEQRDPTKLDAVWLITIGSDACTPEELEEQPGLRRVRNEYLGNKELRNDLLLALLGGALTELKTSPDQLKEFIENLTHQALRHAEPLFHQPGAPTPKSH